MSGVRRHETRRVRRRRTFGLEIDVVFFLFEELLLLDRPFLFEQCPHPVALVDPLLALGSEGHDWLAIALVRARVVVIGEVVFEAEKGRFARHGVAEAGSGKGAHARRTRTSNERGKMGENWTRRREAVGATYDPK